MPELEDALKSEKCAYWYFRLNGFLTIVNFVVHPDSGKKQRTDVDILGVRFPYRAELLENPMDDYEIFTKVKKKPYIVIAEVKTRGCKLNGPWVEKERKNMHRVLKIIGAFPEESIDEIAEQIYDKGIFENDIAYVTLFCIGKRENRDLKKKYPGVPQVTWEQILKFIYERFEKYKDQKSSHPQWDETGRELWRLFEKHSEKEDFIRDCLKRVTCQQVMPEADPPTA